MPKHVLLRSINSRLSLIMTVSVVAAAAMIGLLAPHSFKAST